MSLVIPNNAADFKTNLGLGTAADLDVGTSAGDILQLDGSGNLPAVDGSLITNLSGGGGADNTPFFDIKNTNSLVSLSSATWTTLTNTYFDGTEVDPDGVFNASTGVFTPNVAGWYYISCSINVVGSGSGSLGESKLFLYKNTSTAIHGAVADYGGSNDRRRTSHFATVAYANGTTDNFLVKLWASVATGYTIGPLHFCAFRVDF